MAALLGLTPAEAGLDDRRANKHLDGDDLRRIGQIVGMAEDLRNAGRAGAANRGLTPALADLKQAAAAGQRDTDFSLVLLDGLLAATVVRGDLATEEDRPQTIALAKNAVRVSLAVSDDAGRALALNVLGNQQRIGRQFDGALASVARANALQIGPAAACSSAITIARIASERGDTEQFRDATRIAWTNLDLVKEPTAVINPLSIGEIEVRGLLALGLADEAAGRLEEVGRYHSATIAPQWQIILDITSGEAALAQGDLESALAILAQAADSATVQFLPHQLQRIGRILRAGRSEDARALRLDVLRRVSDGQGPRRQT